MRLFKRKSVVETAPCPECSQLVPRDALSCDMCGADLRERPPRRAVATTKSRESASARN